MSDMDDQTEAFYAHYAQHIAPGAEAARSAMAAHFTSCFEPGSRVLDVGAGSGRDVLALLELGFDAYGVEPVQAMLHQALTRHPELQTRLTPGSLPELGRPFGKADWQAVLCSAVLMHLPPQQMAAAMTAVVALLAPGGRVLLSLPQMPEEKIRADRDPQGRLFYNHPPQAMKALMKRLGMELRGQWDSHAVWEQTGTVWITQWFERAPTPAPAGL